ncbi:Kinesin-like protein KIF2A, partial [Fragariocoptes setiger]
MGDISKFQPGITVDIQRTNGVIHSASVTEIDWNSQCVTVEWSENGDVKGKEVEFQTLFQLNPHLNPVQHGAKKTVAPQPRIARGSQANTQLGGMISSSSSNNNNDNGGHHNHHAHITRASVIQQNHSAIGNINNNKKNSLRMRPPNPRMTISNGSTPALDMPLNSSSVTNINTTTALSLSRATTVAQAAANRRKSNVVKEVDKIKKQREERRAKQEAQKQEKQELMSNVEPGNPNWEFLGMIRDYREQLTYKPITLNDDVTDHQICVAVRKRPLNKKEASRKDVDVVTVPNKNLTIVHEPKQKVDLTRYLENHIFRFDYAFDESANNELVYKYTAKPLVQTIFNGGMATCFAYGQTGSGKTHTMGGDFNGKTQDCSRGIYALVARDVFKLLKSPKYRSENLLVYASFFEIYSGKVFDLLNGKAKLRVLEDAHQQVQVVGLREEVVESVEDVLKLISIGNNIRTSGQTSANNHSSRSHAVFQIILKHNKRQAKIKGKFSLIDLAGNERGADTSSANRQTRMEGAEINKSLLALKECIRALGRKGAHLPFRASKLTQVLRDSFIGENSRTCMIAMISPGMQSCEHSLNTLRYADRVKELGTDDGPELKSEGVDQEDAMSDNGDDLALLHNSNQGEISQDMYTFHEAISHLQDMEDEIQDIHKSLVDNNNIAWHAKYKDLYDMTADVDYDVESYAQQVDQLLEEQIDSLGKFKEKIVNFRAQLNEEEMMSKRMVKQA